MARRSSGNVRVLLTLTLVLSLPAAPTFPVMLWHGQFRVLSASPWKIEVIGEAPDERTGLPYITPDKWRCVGRRPTSADVGRVFRFEGGKPDIGGPYSLQESSYGGLGNDFGEVGAQRTQEPLAFESKYRMRDPMMDEFMSKLRTGVLRSVCVATAAVVGLLLVIGLWRRRRRKRN